MKPHIHCALVLLFALLLVGCATAPPQRGDALSDEDYEMCERAGGCLLITKPKLFELLQRVRNKALGECKDAS